MIKKLITILLLIPSVVFAQWNETNTGTVKSIWDLEKLSTDTLLAVGGYGKVLKSVDNGLNWDSKTTPVPWQILSVDFIDNNTGIAVGEFKNILKTTDQGETWTAMVQTDNTWLTSVKYLDDSTLLTVGYNGVVWKSVDGGVTWPDSISNSPDTTVTFRDIWSFGGGEVFLAGSNGSLFFSNNYGKTWQDYSLSTTNQIRSVYFVDGLKGFLVGDNGLAMKTTDGGLNWTSFSLPTTVELMSVSFYDASNGLIVGNGVIFRTVDGGNTWYSQDYGKTSLLSSILFLDADNILVSGVEGTILKTSNGGEVGIFESKKQLNLSYYFTQDELTINGLLTNIDYQLSIIDINGKNIITRKINSSNNTLEIDGFSSGMYLFTIYNNEQSFSGKIVKK